MDDIYRQPSLTPSKRDLQYVTKVDELMEGSYSSPVFSPKLEDALASMASSRTPRSRKTPRSRLVQQSSDGVGIYEDTISRQSYELLDSTAEDTKEQEKELQSEGSSYFGASANGVNLLLGVGVLSLPYAIKCAGWYVGVGLLVFLTIVTNHTGKLIGKMMDRDVENIRSFGDIGKAAFGSAGQYIITITFFLELFSACGMYLILTGDNLHTLFPQYTQRFWTLIGAAIMVPTALTSKLSFLSYFSVIGTFASTFLCLSVIYLGYILKKDAEYGGGSYIDPAATDTYTNINSAPFSIGLVMVGFAGHACFPSIKLSLANQRDYNAVLNTSYFVCFTFYTSIAILGYLMYGRAVDEEITFNIMKSTGGENVSDIAKSVANLATWLVAINPCTKFGLTMNPVALLVEESFCNSSASEDGIIDDDDKSCFGYFKSFAIRIVLSVSVFFVAVYIPYFADVVAFIGAFCSCFVSLVFPCAAYLQIFKKEISTMEYLLNSFFVFIGLICCVWGTCSVFMFKKTP
jgi:vesicular inhibitory amino acid transporter